MKFSEKLVNEIIEYDYDEDAIDALLAAYLKVNGTVVKDNRRFKLQVKCREYDYTFIYNLINNSYNVDLDLYTREKENGLVYEIEISGFGVTSIVDDLIYSNRQKYYDENKLFIAYIRGMILANFNLVIEDNEEEKSVGYHLGLIVPDIDYAEEVRGVLEYRGIKAKISDWAGEYQIYIKQSEQILKLLNLLKLTECGIYLSKILEEREVANIINRQSICEAANLDKTYNASARQVIAINKVMSKYSLGKLEEGIREVAEARLNWQNKSMSELAEQLNITKSCLNHRMRRIIKMAEDIND
jgi:conserved hypothetical protein